MKLLRKFDEDLKPMIEREVHGNRDALDNIQTRWKKLKEDILMTAQEEAHKRASMVKKNLHNWERRRELILQQEEFDNEARIRLQEIDDEIKVWKAKKQGRKKQGIPSKCYKSLRHSLHATPPPPRKWSKLQHNTTTPYRCWNTTE
ncbi:hypothetical protein FA13DRAFT_1907747 [Coprinellus micaceus]|uniref:Uncharacterized protein n=1 Tax=Coprinellus micaceus TaxID=71717 RepID=A0A4Y7R4V3_COPMI|nr:hypothetical protein FA13DRAFT_1907747 [Coprinellus micaceus]